MNVAEKIIKITCEVRVAIHPDSVTGIIRKNLDNLLEENITGIPLQIFLRNLEHTLESKKTFVQSFAELNNLNWAINLVKHFELLFEGNATHYELN
jgi:hypothetical protein